MVHSASRSRFALPLSGGGVAVIGHADTDERMLIVKTILTADIVDDTNPTGKSFTS